MLNFNFINKDLNFIKVKENHKIGIYTHPIHKEINPILLKTIKDLSKDDPQKKSTNVKANMTDWFIMNEYIARVVKWVELIILKDFSQCYIGQDEKPELKLMDCWGVVYNKNDYTQSHTHDVAYSFVYYVNAPKGSSPFVLDTSGKKIKAEPGRAIIMPGNILHSVPKNKCDDRVVIAGNFNYRI